MSESEIGKQQQRDEPGPESWSSGAAPCFSPENMMKHMNTACGCSSAMSEMAACCGKPEESKISGSEQRAAAGRDPGGDR